MFDACGYLLGRGARLFASFKILTLPNLFVCVYFHNSMVYTVTGEGLERWRSRIDCAQMKVYLRLFYVLCALCIYVFMEICKHI